MLTKDEKRMPHPVPLRGILRGTLLMAPFWILVGLVAYFLFR